MDVDLIAGFVAAAVAVVIVTVICFVICVFCLKMCPIVRASGNVSAPAQPDAARENVLDIRGASALTRPISEGPDAQGRENMASPVQRTMTSRFVKMEDFSAHLQSLHKDSDLLFLEEYEELQNSSPHFPQEVAMREENQTKNRFVNILPYDDNRVQLCKGSGANTSDYINASYIQGFTSRKDYIATQSPLPATVPDFWRMVWEHKCSLIVMIADAKYTVDMYWPGELKVPVQYGDTGIVVEMTSKSAHLHHTVRTFHLYLENGEEETLQVTHYFLPGWDGATTQDWLDCIAAVSQETDDQQRPTIVHCNDGVGNTSVFIALDFLTQIVRNHSLEERVNIYNLVLNMRHNRPFMVQTERQYMFIHEALKLLIDRKMEMVQHDENAYTNPTFETEEEDRYTTLNPYAVIPD